MMETRKDEDEDENICWRQIITSTVAKTIKHTQTNVKPILQDHKTVTDGWHNIH